MIKRVTWKRREMIYGPNEGGITHRLGIGKVPLLLSYIFCERSQAQKRFHFCIKTYLSVNLGV